MAEYAHEVAVLLGEYPELKSTALIDGILTAEEERLALRLTQAKAQTTAELEQLEDARSFPVRLYSCTPTDSY